MLYFVCPVCGKPLFEKENKTALCPAGHSYDKAKSGYYNLLMSKKSGLSVTGDDKTMVSARKAFLERGYYQPFMDALNAALTEVFPHGGLLIDCGAGEGYFTKGFYRALQNRCPRICGIDISRDAIDAAAKQYKNLSFAVASVHKLPFADRSCDTVTNIFAPHSQEEFDRVLKRGGYLLKAVPLSFHLYELKELLYEHPYLNEEKEEAFPAFMLIKKQEIKYEMKIENSADIMNLFSMTPYLYKTSPEAAKKLISAAPLSVTAYFGIRIYKK